ncbi:MerR family transcriptional regulator [Nocardioides bruguierae]|uniref:MerR family transcriptional regulator n=1 Tax=Nocardioides bruguierae TaxID=2945102 RepID=A0A9X2D4U6_9ACTN|nr:MerR family transcriptional regulator [Nocardioides bruguierae]MCM0619039.1 MerR family transcriptional regulator [Nocardioides bruguierae]
MSSDTTPRRDGSNSAAPPARSIGEVAEEAGVPVTAVRFYADHGVLAATRDGGNRRRFDDSASCRIRVAKLAQRVGLTVREIGDLFGTLPPDPDPEDWRAVAETLVSDAEQRVADLRRCLDQLESGGKLCEAVDRL